jgi:hypothetical protein
VTDGSRHAKEDAVKKSVAWLAVTVAVLNLETSPDAAVRLLIPPDPGPPFYASIDAPPTGQIFQDGHWAAIPFLRDTGCVPGDSNLLVAFDPRAFDCPLSVHGFAIYKNGPYPIDPVPLYAFFIGNGAVPIWFVRWPELQSAIADGELTIDDLATMPSLLVGSASFFELVNHIGTLRPQGPGNGKIEISSSGALDDGREFQFSVREMGVDRVSTLRHIRIEFR